jgi:hypothetical protein
MTNEYLLPTREDAQATGLALYGNMQEISGEDMIEGTGVSAISVKDDSIVLSSFTERQYFLTEKGYRRAIRRELRSTARFIGRTVKIISS